MSGMMGDADGQRGAPPASSRALARPRRPRSRIPLGGGVLLAPPRREGGAHFPLTTLPPPERNTL